MATVATRQRKTCPTPKNKRRASYPLVIGDHKVSQVPGVLISLYLNLLGLFVHRQFACRQHRAGALSVGREDQLDGADAVVAGARAAVELTEGDVAIGDKAESAAFLGGQFDDVLDIIAYTPTGEPDTALGLHVLEGIYKPVLATACEGVDQNLPIVRRGKTLNEDVNISHLAHLRVCAHGGRLDRHAFLSLDACAKANQQEEEGSYTGFTEKSIHDSHIRSPYRGRRVWD